MSVEGGANDLYAIGAENHVSLDFLAPFFYGSDWRLKVVYFEEEESPLRGSTVDYQEQVGRFIRDSPPAEVLQVLDRNLRTVLGHEFKAARSRDVVAALYVDVSNVEFTVATELPTVGGLQRVVERLDSSASAAASAGGLDDIELKTRGTRTCLRYRESDGWRRIAGIHVSASRGIMRLRGLTSVEKECNPVAPVHCGGDYALLKTLTHGVPAYLPWYQRWATREGAVTFPVVSPFEPIYSLRLNRNTAIRRALAGHTVAVGFLWHLRAEANARPLAEFLTASMPSRITRAFCDMTMRPSLAMTVRRRGALDTIRGALNLQALLDDDGLWRLASQSEGVQKEGAFYVRLIALLLGESCRRRLASLGAREASEGHDYRPPAEVLSWADALLDIQARFDARDEGLGRYMNQVRDVSRCTDEQLALDLTYHRQHLASLATAVRGDAVSALVDLWDWADTHFRWSSYRSLAIGVRPVPSDEASALVPVRYVLDLSTVKVLIKEP